MPHMLLIYMIQGKEKNGTTIIDTLMQDSIWGILKILVIHVWHCFVFLFIYFSSSVNAKKSTTIIR